MDNSVTNSSDLISNNPLFVLIHNTIRYKQYLDTIIKKNGILIIPEGKQLKESKIKINSKVIKFYCLIPGSCNNEYFNFYGDRFLLSAQDHTITYQNKSDNKLLYSARILFDELHYSENFERYTVMYADGILHNKQYYHKNNCNNHLTNESSSSCGIIRPSSNSLSNISSIDYGLYRLLYSNPTPLVCSEFLNSTLDDVITKEFATQNCQELQIFKTKLFECNNSNNTLLNRKKQDFALEILDFIKVLTQSAVDKTRTIHTNQNRTHHINNYTQEEVKGIKLAFQTAILHNFWFDLSIFYLNPLNSELELVLTQRSRELYNRVPQIHLIDLGCEKGELCIIEQNLAIAKQKFCSLAKLSSPLEFLNCFNELELILSAQNINKIPVSSDSILAALIHIIIDYYGTKSLSNNNCLNGAKKKYLTLNVKPTIKLYSILDFCEYFQPQTNSPLLDSAVQSKLNFRLSNIKAAVSYIESGELTRQLDKKLKLQFQNIGKNKINGTLLTLLKPEKYGIEIEKSLFPSSVADNDNNQQQDDFDEMFGSELKTQLYFNNTQQSTNNTSSIPNLSSSSNITRSRSSAIFHHSRVFSSPQIPIFDPLTSP